MTSQPGSMSLHEAAEALGVHYMTAYRYVRLGQLEARKVGGTWQVAEVDLEAFQARPTAASGTRQCAPWAQRLEHRLVAGDANGAWGVIEAALSGGSDVEEIYLDVISPAMTSIGERWSIGELDIAVEHRASVIVTRLLGRLGHRFARRGRSKGTVVVGAPSGEFHSLPVAMAADLVRQNGWEVSDLGADVPPLSFVHAAKEADDLVAVGLSVTVESSLTALYESLVVLREGVSSDVMLIVGGRAIRDHAHAAELGADGFAADGRSFGVLLDRFATRGGTASAS
jgi:excisionase family DNA binding protein